MERDKNLRIYTKMHLIFSLCSGFNHLPWANVGSCTPISCYFCPLIPKYVFFKIGHFGNFLFPPHISATLVPQYPKLCGGLFALKVGFKQK